jgi:hypothetical protein
VSACVDLCSCRPLLRRLCRRGSPVSVCTGGLLGWSCCRVMLLWQAACMYLAGHCMRSSVRCCCGASVCILGVGGACVYCIVKTRAAVCFAAQGLYFLGPACVCVCMLLVVLSPLWFCPCSSRCALQQCLLGCPATTVKMSRGAGGADGSRGKVERGIGQQHPAHDAAAAGR